VHTIGDAIRKMIVHRQIIVPTLLLHTSLLTALFNQVVSFPDIVPKVSRNGGLETSLTSNDESTTFVSTDDRTLKEDNLESERRLQKQILLGLIGCNESYDEERKLLDPILAYPVTKQPLTVVTNGPILGGQSSVTGVKVIL